MLDQPNSPLAAFDGLTFGPRQDSPIWQQIYDHILGLIETGALSAGEQLPGENHMAARLGVTRITLRRALQQFAEGRPSHRPQGRRHLRAQPALDLLDPRRPFLPGEHRYPQPLDHDRHTPACARAG
ncbi:MAG: GntR family transcriptional regulator [Rhizobium sp.]|nr:GntR family transcriptional regulator [Rhizobium sp.]